METIDKEELLFNIDGEMYMVTLEILERALEKEYLLFIRFCKKDLFGTYRVVNTKSFKRLDKDVFTSVNLTSAIDSIIEEGLNKISSDKTEPYLKEYEGNYKLISRKKVV